ncbi:MAG: hypothetical protein J0I12_11315 [Candidatus Eremiobacteraeota bacterium]|nr:hypothetical protein [Candidatus Eremiobacteraeota bacterium]
MTTLIYCITICVMMVGLCFIHWVDHLRDLNSRYTLEEQPEESPLYTLEAQRRQLPPE